MIERNEFIDRVYVAAQTREQFERFATTVKSLAVLEGTPIPKVILVQHTDSLLGIKKVKMHILPGAKVRSWPKMDSLCKGNSISYYYWTYARLELLHDTVDELLIAQKEVMQLDAGLRTANSDN